MIPFDFNTLTVRQYQVLNEIFDSEAELLDKQINAIAYLLGRSTIWVESLPLDKFKYYAGQLTFIKQPNINTKIKKYVFVGGVLFKAETEFEKLLAGQYIDLKELAKDGSGVKNLHKLLACIYKPVFFKYDHKKCSEIMLNAKLGKVYGLLFFCTNELERLNDYILTSLEEANKTIAEAMNEMRTELEAL